MTGAPSAGAATTWIDSREALRAVLGEPSDLVLRKAIPRLDRHARTFIAKSPFLVIGTADADGRGDTSPRGDPPGFVKVLDDGTLLIPDRPGNNRADTLVNIIDNPECAVIFMIPGIEETLRVNGTARVTADQALLAQCAEQGRTPRLGIVLSVREAFLHCAKAFRRSHLWQDEARQARGDLPSLAQIVMEQLSGQPADPAVVKSVDAQLEEDYKATMY
ncbi:pyridoxamine 5'-phosphate oxidase family protein [Zavarzinia sp. CC-PAN008]|uniref:pyridoxamine 5'-phosphate oxidase family protein n=1 Tax=Zavarzinia sp. CC-PAN008 TaxID=3243332 RepID=UPI003F749708